MSEQELSEVDVQPPRPESIQEIKQKFSKIMANFNQRKDDLIDREETKANKMSNLKTQIKQEIKQH